MVDEPSVSVRRLTDLSSYTGIDTTLQNLLATATTKLELCGRLALLEYEAHMEKHETAAAAFRELAIAERATCKELLRHLHRYLEETVDREEDGGLLPDPEHKAAERRHRPTARTRP